MKTAVYIFATLISLIYVVESFWKPEINPEIFGFGVGLWFYRIFWIVLLVSSAKETYKRIKR